MRWVDLQQGTQSDRLPPLAPPAPIEGRTDIPHHHIRFSRPAVALQSIRVLVRQASMS